MTETQFPKYEIMLVLQPDLGEEETNSLLKEMKDLISEADGKIVHEDIWGLRELAYVIKKQRQGYYVVWNFTADPIKVKAFEKQLNIHQGILRYLIQKTPKGYEVVTLAQYEEIAKEEELKAQEEAKKKAEKMGSSRPKPRRYEKPVRKETPVTPAKEEEKEEKKDKKPAKKVKKEEVVEETKEKVEAPKAKKQAENLDDVDAKLKSIIDDPDIKL